MYTCIHIYTHTHTHTLTLTHTVVYGRHIHTQSCSYTRIHELTLAHYQI